MSTPAYCLPLDVDDYLRGEQDSPIRHEYVAGQTFAMAGADEAHNRIAGNLFFHLRAGTRGTPCAVFINDMKVRVMACDAFYYPDVMLSCEPGDRKALYKADPCLIAELLSPSTESIDRREKLIAYRTLPSLRYYLLVAQDRRWVQVYTRHAEGGWRQTVHEDGALTLDCGGLTLEMTLAELYEDVIGEA